MSQQKIYFITDSVFCQASGENYPCIPFVKIPQNVRYLRFFRRTGSRRTVRCPPAVRKRKNYKNYFHFFGGIILKMHAQSYIM